MFKSLAIGFLWAKNEAQQTILIARFWSNLKCSLTNMLTPHQISIPNIKCEWKNT